MDTDFKDSVCAGNYQLDKLGDDKFELHYLGDGWGTVQVTLRQVKESGSFFSLWEEGEKNQESWKSMND